MLNKKVLVAGAGKSGVAASELLARNNESVILYDENKKGELDAENISVNFPDNIKGNIEIILGEISDEIISGCEFMVISPGIPTDNEFSTRVRTLGLRILSEIELAYLYEKGEVLAITGTNGKTTTTSLVGEIMKAYNENTYVVGNIGIPYTSIADKTTEDSVTVAEISSFQLETIEKFKPHISAVLNITPDHIDRHHTFENYAECKMDIAKNQFKDDYIVLNYDDPETIKRAELDNVNVVLFSRIKHLDEGVYVDRDDVVIRKDNVITKVLSLNDIQLLGTHNVENILAAVAITYYAGVPIKTIEKVCTEFKGVEHRIEYVRTVNGVKYYNDSKGTNPDAAIKGIKAMTTTTFLIGGGYDKGVGFDEWIEAFDAKVKYLVLIGQTAKTIATCAKNHGFNSIMFMDSLEEAVDFCYKNAKPGDAVLLSPACASWGMFKNYEERGNLFKEYVMKLEE
ncbi:MAG: UDP-N-acetylmuramoyl-L-alanine--D-glutamate ligase [Lachnospiraceae bacterium]|nr:UDP-N-acetylmuramoyl-L-alanine--D-glutamate ligase [Lachnospiraceae bacterium]